MPASQQARKDAVETKRAQMPTIEGQGLFTMLVPERMGLVPAQATTSGTVVKFMMAGIDNERPPNVAKQTETRLKRLSGAIASQAFASGFDRKDVGTACTDIGSCHQLGHINGGGGLPRSVPDSLVVPCVLRDPPH